MELIFRKTRRERDDGLRESARRSTMPNVRAEVRTSEEAFETARSLEREQGEEFKKLYAVSGQSAEAKQAESDLLIRHGLDPEGHGYLHSDSTAHDR